MVAKLLCLGLAVAFEDDEASMLLAARLNLHRRINATATSTPEYVLSQVPAPNAWKCHAGTRYVGQEQECWDACNANGYGVKAGHRKTKAEWRWPNGCYVRNDTSAAALNHHCIWNVHNEVTKTHWQYDETQSLCVVNPPTTKDIVITAETSKIKWANSNGNFYIKFPGDDLQEDYSLYSGGNDFEKGKTDVWSLTVGQGADLSKPTIFIKEHNDAWIPKSIIITEGGDEKFTANGLPAIIDGNCHSAGIQWGGYFCTKSMTWPFQTVVVTTETATDRWANSDGKIFLKFEGDHRKYILDPRKKPKFQKGHTDRVALKVSNSADIMGPVQLSIKHTDGWIPKSITLKSGDDTHELKKSGKHELPFWLDGNCHGVRQLGKPCSSQWDFN